MRDHGKVKTVQVDDQAEINNVLIDVGAEVELIQDAPDESMILNAIDADGNDVLAKLSTSDSLDLVRKAQEIVDADPNFWETAEC